MNCISMPNRLPTLELMPSDIALLKECRILLLRRYKHDTPIGVNQVLLIRLPFVFQPARHVSSLGIVVRPMNDAALRVPNVLSVKPNTVAFL